ncbi:MAG TPA: family 10 glycosylhydrolase [Vicinamibacterales bacterium]|nr:family 10 glycosylhydrolase [Vicinamibacterales bacterium]
MRQIRTGWWPLAVAALATLFAGGTATAWRSSAADGELRALWVLRTSLTSPESIATVVARASEHGFNALFVQVRGRGDAYYRGALEPIPAAIQRQPESFDPLTAVIDAAHASGIQVHAWINVNLVSSAVELPTAREHLVHRSPEWLMVPRDIAQELAGVPVDSPAYLGKLARWSRQQSAEVEGLYTSPILPAAAAHLEAVVRDIVTRYGVDGVHFDYARYPTDRFDYSRAAIAAFRATVMSQLPDGQRRALDAEAAVDLFAWPDALPEEWRAYRVDRMTALMTRLGSAVKAVRPTILVSVAAAPDRAEALHRRLQDWGTWITEGIVDAVAPMAYTQELARFAEQIAAAREIAGPRRVWAGIGAYRLSPEQTVENIGTARRLGAAGIILFSYDSLINPRQTAPDYLPIVSRAAFGPRSGASGSRE